MKYLHTMIRISNIEKSLNFYCKGLGLKETRRINDEKAEIELTYNWDGNDLGSGSRNFGHLAYRVSDIYEICQRLKSMGVTINRPPRDGHMAFVRSPDNISIEILQEGNLEPKEPWASMENIGEW
jgi:lactoylglutathione lyase